MSGQNDLTPSMLAGTPVGTADGEAACDTCNRRLTDGERDHDPDDKEADTVYAYATRAPQTQTWMLNWVSCESCGPPGIVSADMPDGMDESDELLAKVTLGYDERVDALVLTDPELADQTEGEL